ncbi:hypothetical protein STENM36S_04396 [Streptomyces tendae]
MVVERRRVPGVKRPSSQAAVAPSAVVRARCLICLSRGSPSTAVPSGAPASAASCSGSPVFVTATAIAGNRSVKRLTSSIWRVDSGAAPPSTVPRMPKPTSPALPPIRIGDGVGDAVPQRPALPHRLHQDQQVVAGDDQVGGVAGGGRPGR